MEQKEMNAQTGNKMGVMPIRKLIVNMSVPMMISMLVQAAGSLQHRGFRLCREDQRECTDSGYACFPHAESHDLCRGRHRRRHQRSAVPGTRGQRIWQVRQGGEQRHLSGLP